MECVEALFDDFSVDDLLDLSNADDFTREATQREEDEQVQHKRNSFSDQSVHLSSSEDFLFLPGTELDIPADDLADLEWLSNFVEDSLSAPYISGDFPVKPNSLSGGEAPTVLSVVTEKSSSRIPVPAKPRSKRRRTGGRVWSLEPHSSNDTPASSSSSSFSVASGPSNSSLSLTAKKGRKRKAKAEAVSRGGCHNQPRRCSHCGVQKTPQWRMGPLGAKTLCNACGVRFKSGRLLPEYRPACSPTFSSEIHSNSHRKVLELRQNKEALASRVEPGLTRPGA